MLNELNGSLLDARFVPKAGEPRYVRLAAKPCHLALGIVAMSLLCGLNRGITINFSAESLNCLFISKRGKRAGRIPVFFKHASSFFDQTGIEHLLCTLVDALIER